MASYETTKSAATGISLGQGWAGQSITDRVSLSLTTAMIDNTNDSIGLMYVPAGAIITSVTLSATDMDSNNSPTLAFDIGDSGDQDRLMAASTVGQAGTLSTAMARTGHNYQYTSRTQLRAYVQAAAATAVAGTLNFSVTYTVDPTTFAALTPA